MGRLGVTDRDGWGAERENVSARCDGGVGPIGGGEGIARGTGFWDGVPGDWGGGYSASSGQFEVPRSHSKPGEVGGSTRGPSGA